MQPVAVRILHPTGSRRAPLEAALLAARAANAARLVRGFQDAGAGDVELIEEPDGDLPFGSRLARLATSLPDSVGLVVLGSGAVPLARPADLGAFVEVAASGQRRALANNRFSADVVALGVIGPLRNLPPLPGDNALPRWLEEVAGFEVADLRDRWALAMDLDSPLDEILVDGAAVGASPVDAAAVETALGAVRAVAGDPRAELVLAGRSSAGTLAWLEGATVCRVRALLEERGLRAASRLALGRSAGARQPRPPRSALGLLLDDRGASALGGVAAELGDAAVIDTRVLLAHRLGADEAAWPAAEDRFASDLLLPERVADPWLRELTAAAAAAPIPILLGGHSLVGPGIRLALGDRP